MSWRASAYIKELLVCPNGDQISRTEKLVAMILADSHQDKAKAYTFPAVATIAADAVMDERVCRRILGALERKGVIFRERAERQGRGQMTYYRFPALDGEAKTQLQKGDTMSSFFSGERGTEGGPKGDKNGVAYKEEQKQEQKQKQLPLIPSLHEGSAPVQATRAAALSPSSAAQSSRSAAIDRALEQIANALSITRRRTLREIRKQIALEADKGEPPATIALEMIAAFRKQSENEHQLRAHYGPEKFFGLGIWKDTRRWYWDQARIEQLAGASVGSYRQ